MRADYPIPSPRRLPKGGIAGRTCAALVGIEGDRDFAVSELDGCGVHDVAPKEQALSTE
ncbi:hypothetical protein ABIB95_007757 [Bradyrhizobium sp. LA2.1]